MQLYTRTDIGLVRSSNQDCVDGGFLFDGKLMWAVLCDGMGGANGGNVASQTAVDVTKKMIVAFDRKSSDYQAEDFLRDILDKANSAIYNKQRKDFTLQGMGTTMELIVAHKGWAMIIHVGDSRVYRIHNKKIKQLTQDHSVVQEMVNRGEITLEQAQVHPNKNFITRAVGVDPYVIPDYIEAPFSDEDILIVCSDGLTNYISDQQILSYAESCSGDELTDALTEEAKRNGGGDNISVAVMYANNIRE